MKTPMVSPRQIKYTNCVEAGSPAPAAILSRESFWTPPTRASDQAWAWSPHLRLWAAHQAFFGTSATSRIEVDNVSS